MNTKKTNKTLTIIVVILVLLLAGVLAGSGMYLKGQYDRTTFFANTTINGYDASEQTPNQLLEKIVQDYSVSSAVLLEDGEEVLSGQLSEFGYIVNQDKLLRSLQEKLQMQKSSIPVLISSLLNGNSFSVVVPYTYIRESLENKVTASNLSAARVENTNAQLMYNETENSYYIEPEVQGTTFRDEDLQAAVKEQIDSFVSGNNPGKSLSIEFPTEIYIAPEIDQNNTELVTQRDVYNSYVKAKITYTFGTETKVLDWSTIQGWISIDGTTGILNDQPIREYVDTLAAGYNTRHYDRTFHTSIGTDITISGSENDYGFLVNEEAEYTQLVADILSNSEITREPVYISANDYGNPVYYKRNGRDDLAGTYVEVNLTRQHLWFYKDGNLVVESDIVSGSVAKDAETKTGVFPLAYKESPSVLVGQDAADGYRTEVQYWMPFYDGQGLHDASWRSSFGGNIYQTNGSHGCVNCPPAVAKAIYDQIDAGVAIIIYK